jgi:hypothetical protein
MAYNDLIRWHLRTSLQHMSSTLRHWLWQMFQAGKVLADDCAHSACRPGRHGK